MISEEQFLKWLWMADWCKDTEISPYKSENWSNAEPEQLKVMPFIWDMYQQVLKDKQ